MVRILRLALHRVMTSAAEAYHKQSSAELDRLAHTDTLTGLHNRRYMEQELDRHVELYKRYRHPFAILMLDLDSLKLVNDTFGHAAGDEALQTPGRRRCGSNIRDTDIPCRYGGDEFVILMPEADRSAIQARWARGSRSPSARPGCKMGGGFVEPGSELRGRARAPRTATTAEALLKVADADLYAPKSARRGAGARSQAAG